MRHYRDVLCTGAPSTDSIRAAWKRSADLFGQLTSRIAEHRVSPIKNLATGACHENPNSRFSCELSLRSFDGGPNRFHCRIKYATNQCAERQQCVSRVLLHAEARYGPTV